MWGAILGDMIGSPYEFDRGDKTKDFPLFSDDSYITDDTVMTIAVAEALLDSGSDADKETIERNVINSMRKWGRAYPHAGYGGMFLRWLMSENPKPYGSFGNGSAMRVSAAGWLYDTEERTKEVAGYTAAVTHNHPDGIKGAEATALAIFYARNGCPKSEIKLKLCVEFDYDLSMTCDELRPLHNHVETCEDSLPKAFAAFYDGKDFEDVIRNAVSLGGDTDTIAAIAGSMAEAFYDIPDGMIPEAMRCLSPEMMDVIDRMHVAVEENFRRIHGEE